MFKPATTAFLLTAAFTSAFAAHSVGPSSGSGVVAQPEPLRILPPGFKPANPTAIAASHKAAEIKAADRDADKVFRQYAELDAREDDSLDARMVNLGQFRPRIGVAIPPSAAIAREDDSLEARMVNFGQFRPRIGVAIPPSAAIAREDVDARGIGGKIASGAGGAAASWLLNKLRDEDSVEARFACPLGSGGCGPGPVMNTPLRVSSIIKMGRDDLETRGGVGKALTSVGGQAAGGAASAFTTWALNKIRREELEARGAAGKALTSVGGQAANGAAGTFTTWALNKLRREHLEEAREALEELLARYVVNNPVHVSSIIKMGREDLEARSGVGKALTNVGGQAANGAAGAFTTWALNKLRDDLEEARDDLDAREHIRWTKPLLGRAMDDLLEARDDEEYLEAREFFENYLEAREYELEDLE